MRVVDSPACPGGSVSSAPWTDQVSGAPSTVTTTPAARAAHSASARPRASSGLTTPSASVSSSGRSCRVGNLGVVDHGEEVDPVGVRAAARRSGSP